MFNRGLFRRRMRADFVVELYSGRMMIRD
ncbi:hypothetical protein CCACVL1_17476 [Corchorus capsularis]|uniref:Uncharacterized protein n=1 Tax=Corchorus capsularis TaxID=210143 RepID=A0A1R3HRP9_COCAP|nr:hypothetical protein CCACVL1_17476 [Corchorus capsularis]